jgi:anti-sigma factor (TIGR02949 family)
MNESEPIDCRAVTHQLYEFLDGELSAAAKARVQAHLADCAHCFELADFETAYLRFLEARARARGAPAHLRRRILDELLSGPEPPASR